MLTAESGDVEKISEIIAECKRMGFQVLPPAINESFSDFTIVRDEKGEVTKKIRFGLRSIKNFGNEIGKAIIHERKTSGPFKSLTDFLDRVQHKNLNKKSLEALIMSGAFDRFGDRGELAQNVENLLSYVREAAKNLGQNSLFGALGGSALPGLRLEKGDPVSQETKLNWEKELLGLYISGHPLDKWRDALEKSNMNIKRIKEEFGNGMEISIIGLLEEIRAVTTKQMSQMAFVKFTDFTGTIETVLFPKNYEECKNLLGENKCLFLKGRVSLRNGEKSLIIEKIKELV